MTPMKKIKTGLPVVALIAAIIASAFTLPNKKHVRTDSTRWLQQNSPGEVLWTSPSGPTGLGWTDVTDSIEMDPFLYSDEQWHCKLSSSATCIVGVNDEGAVVDSYDGISVKF
jgi:hypothetical protein